MISARRHIPALLVLAAILLLSSSAWAKAGEGFRSGNLKLHPGVLLGTAVNSNVFYQSPNEDADILLGPSLRIMPELLISTLDPNMFDFQARGNVAWRQYISSQQFVAAQSGLTANVGGAGTFNPNGSYSLKLEGLYQRTNEPPTTPFDEALNRDVIRVGTVVGLHPGGRILEILLGYSYNMFLFDILPSFDHNFHNLDLNVNWKLLPKTTLMFLTNFRVINYSENVLSGLQGTPLSINVNNNNSLPLKLHLGAQSLITQRLRLRALLGWGWGFYQGGPTYSGLLAQVEGGYYLGDTSRASQVFLGYQRDFNDVVFANFYGLHRIYLGYTQHFGATANFHLTGRVDLQLRDYNYDPIPQIPTDTGGIQVPPTLSDTLLNFRLSAGYDIFKWFTITGTYRFDANFTDDVIAVSGVGSNTFRDYNRHLVDLTFLFRY